MRKRQPGFLSSFPGGWPGIGLLLLRLVAGAAAIAQGIMSLEGENHTFLAWSMGLLGMAGGSLMVVGSFTATACVLVVLAALGRCCSSFTPTVRGIFEALLPTILVIVIAIGVALLGPGAFSIDGRRFGRREIIIPPSPPSPGD